MSNKPRYTWTKVCEICSNEFKAWRKKQVLCRSCNELNIACASERSATGNYVIEKGIHLHRQIAERIIGRSLKENEIVHHIDQNPKNNDLDNLLVMYREDHVRLHVYLNQLYTTFYYYKCEHLFNRCVSSFTTEWFNETKKFVLLLS